MNRLFVSRRRRAEQRVLRALTAGDAYGWDLRGVTGLGPRRLERALHDLERDGRITSRLAESEAGPNIRLYSLTHHPEQ